MGRVEGSSKLCAFCTKLTAYSIPSWIGAGILHRFYSEFLKNSSSISPQIIKVNCKPKKRNKLTGQLIKNNNSQDEYPPPPENWTVCAQCLPFIQSALESKENVNKVECRVRKLQSELLKDLQKLVVETNKMCGDLQKIEAIGLERPAEKGGFEDIAAVLVQGGRPALKKQEEKFVDQFKEKIKTVIQEMKVFKKKSSEKMLKNPDEPSIKLGQLDTNLESAGNFNDKFENEVESDNSSDDFSNLDDQSNPSSLYESQECTQIRINLIKRIKLGRTIATSKNLPLSMDDPRHSYSIEHSRTGSDSKFFVQDTEIIVVDEGLQCGTCRFKVEASPLLPADLSESKRAWNFEDKMFEHVLSKHLKLYNCSICGLSSETFLNWRAHKQSHLKRKAVGKGKVLRKKKSRRN